MTEESIVKGNAIFLIMVLALLVYIALVVIFSYKDFANWNWNTKNIILKLAPGILIIFFIGMYSLKTFNWKQLAVLMILVVWGLICCAGWLEAGKYIRRATGKEIPGESREEK